MHRRVRRSRAQANVQEAGEARITGRELEKLLSPMKVKIFLDQFWQKKPIYIRGRRDKFAGLFDRATFDRCLGADVEIHANVGDLICTASRPQIQTFMEGGATICVTHLQRGAPQLAAFSAAVKAQLHYPGTVSVRAYLSPDGAGFPVHFDARIATALQIEGKKRWRFSSTPAVPFPLDNAVRNGKGFSYANRSPGDIRSWERIPRPDEKKFEEVVLEPGDLLCLPAGTWHTAKALGGSLALNLAFEGAGFFSLVCQLLETRLTKNPAWRQSPPPIAASQDHQGQLPSEVEKFFASRLAELRAMVDRLEPGGLELTDAWRRAVMTKGKLEGEKDEQSSNRPSNARRSVSRKDILSLWPGKPATYGLGPGPDGERLIYLYHANEQAGFPEDFLPFVRTLTRRRKFLAEEAMNWAESKRVSYSWQSVKEVLDVLLLRGILKREAKE